MSQDNKEDAPGVHDAGMDAERGGVIKKRGNMKRRMEDKVGDQGDK